MEPGRTIWTLTIALMMLLGAALVVVHAGTEGGENRSDGYGAAWQMGGNSLDAVFTSISLAPAVKGRPRKHAKRSLKA